MFTPGGSKSDLYLQLFLLCILRSSDWDWDIGLRLIQKTQSILKLMVSKRKCKYLHCQKSNQGYSGVKLIKMSMWHSGLIIARQLKQRVSTLCLIKTIHYQWWIYGNAPGMCPLSQQFKSFLNSCSFLEILAKSYVSTHWMVGASSYGESWICPWLPKIFWLILNCFTWNLCRI